MSFGRMIKVVLGTVTFTVPVTLTILDVFGYVAKVEGVSMQPSFNPAGQKGTDFVFLNKWAARNHEFERGQVVSLISPSNADQRLIKRIIGKEGDTVKTLQHKRRYVTVPDGHCWVEGDHHGQSLDSNFFGAVSISLIQSKASHIVWPPARWRRVIIEPEYTLTRVNTRLDLLNGGDENQSKLGTNGSVNQSKFSTDDSVDQSKFSTGDSVNQSKYSTIHSVTNNQSKVSTDTGNQSKFSMNDTLHQSQLSIHDSDNQSSFSTNANITTHQSEAVNNATHQSEAVNMTTHQSEAVNNATHQSGTAIHDRNIPPITRSPIVSDTVTLGDTIHNKQFYGIKRLEFRTVK